MRPTEMNMLITAITNHLYCSLQERDFLNLGIFLSMLSKSMFDMAALKDLCKHHEREAALIEAANSGAVVAVEID